MLSAPKPCSLVMEEHPLGSIHMAQLFKLEVDGQIPPTTSENESFPLETGKLFLLKDLGSPKVGHFGIGGMQSLPSAAQRPAGSICNMGMGYSTSSLTLSPWKTNFTHFPLGDKMRSSPTAGPFA